MLRRRQCQRYTKRLEVTFISSDGSKHRGISSDLSAGGLFIRTQHGLNPGTFIDIEIYMPDQRVCNVKGIVRRTVKTSLSVKKNGMGIEIIERDQHYLELLKSVSSVIDTSEESGPPPAEEDEDLQEEPGEGPAPKTGEAREQKPDALIITCKACNAKNRVPRERLSLGPRCGKCGEPLPLEDRD